MVMKNNQVEKDRWMKLPVKVGKADFGKYIDPYLSRGRRGPDTKMPRWKIFNHILYVLHTGIQWNELPMKHGEVYWTNIYRWHNKWSKDGSYRNLFETSLMFLNSAGKLDISIIHGDGSNTIAKKGVLALGIQGTNIRRA